MEIEIQNAVGLFFPTPYFQQIYLEAVVNALDAGATKIEITIKTRSFTSPETLKVTITDNGSGFTDDRFDRFRKLLNPKDSYHKGLGRLVFLKYFKQVEVESRYEKSVRTFTFSSSFDGKNKVKTLDKEVGKQTTLLFRDFAGKGFKSYDDLKPKAVVERLVLEILPRLYEMKKTGRQLEIVVTLETQEGNPSQDFFNDTQIFKLDKLPELTEVVIKDEVVDMYEEISMAYRIETSFGKNSVVTAACVDERTIPLDLIPPDGIPNNYSVIFLFNSKIFKADNSRQRLEIKDDAFERLLMRLLRKSVAEVINDKIPAVKEKNQSTKVRFLERYPHLIGYFEDETVGLIQKDEALEMAQKRFFKDQKEILEATNLDEQQYQKSLDVSSRTLTEYILYRTLIIKKLKQINDKNTEAEIHNLIVPRRKIYNGSDMVQSVYSNNAWLLDDKFMSFSTILSEARMDTVIGHITLNKEQAADSSRPDISMIFSGDPDSTAKVDVVVVELKKRTDDEMENSYALTQLLQRAEKLVRHFGSIQRIWYYAVLQINDSFGARLEQMGYSPLFSKGKVYYREALTKAPDGTQIPTPLFVLSFDAVIDDAECRNDTFLKILREGMKQIGTKNP
jgi:hypothetical protein